MKAQQAAKQLTALTQVLGFSLGKFNVEVTISGGGAYHRYDPSSGLHSVNLPVGDFSNPKYLRMAIGFIYHEIGHGIKTVSHNLRFKYHFEHTLWNALEDIWMERAIGRMSSGAKVRLNDMTLIAREYGMFHGEPMDDTSQSLKSYCLHYCRSKFLGNPVEDLAVIRKAELEAALGSDVVSKITALLDQMEHCESSLEAKRISEEILELIQQEEQQEEQQGECSDSSDSSDGGNSGDDSGEGADESEGKHGSSESSNDDASDSGSDEQEGDGGNASDADSSSDSNQGNCQSSAANGESGDEQSKSSSNEKHPSTKEKLKALKQILVGTQGVDEDYHDQIAEKLGELAQQARHEGVAFPFVATKLERLEATQPLDVPMSTRNLSSKIYSILNKVLVDLARTQDLYTQQGRKLAQKRLAGIQSGNFNVFERKGESKGSTAAVSVLVDRSGSMRGIMNETNQIAYAFAEGLTRGSTPIEVLYFSDIDEPVIQAKSFSEKRVDRKRFNINVYGGTDTHVGIYRSILSLHQQDVNNKVMIIITDGEPYTPAYTAKAVELALSQGIKVIPILMGVKKSRAEGFEQLDCIEIAPDPAELAPQLQKAVKRNLFS